VATIMLLAVCMFFSLRANVERVQNHYSPRQGVRQG
jgi:hypothetical protein